MNDSTPRNISRRDAARALSVCERTIAALLNLPFNEKSKYVSLAKLARATRSDAAWILSCMRGEDSAVTPVQANALKGGTGHLRPKATLRRGERYSARELGLYQPAISPLAGRPDSNVLGPNGWETLS